MRSASDQDSQRYETQGLGAIPKEVCGDADAKHPDGPASTHGDRWVCRWEHLQRRNDGRNPPRLSNHHPTSFERGWGSRQSLRTKPFTLDDAYYFVEKDQGAFDSLTETLKSSEFAGLIGSKANLISGDFSEQSNHLIDFVNQRGKAGRSLFVLDQCGYSAVTLHAINTILASIKNAEIILTFATDFLIDYLTDDETSRAIINSIGLNHRELLSGLNKNDPLWRKTIQFGLP